MSESELYKATVALDELIDKWLDNTEYSFIVPPNLSALMAIAATTVLKACAESSLYAQEQTEG